MAIRDIFRLADPYGNHLIEIADYISADTVLNCSPGGIGMVELTLPASFDASLLRYDGRIGKWRSIHGRPAYHDNGAIFLIQTFVHTANATVVRAYHATQLMERRIIAYPAASSYSDKTDYADDMIKAFWSENAGAGISSANRDGVETQADISAYVSVQADLSQGVSFSKGAARKNLLDTCTEIAQTSADRGTYVTFEIIAPTESTLELRTYANQRGVDRRSSTASPLVLSEARGNLENAELTIDYRDMATMIIAGGPGEKAERYIDARAVGTIRFALSPFARIERFLDDANTVDIEILFRNALAQLVASREVVTMTGDLIETPATTRGIHFDLGDIVTAEHPRTHQQFDMRIDVIHETIDQSGRRSQITLRSVE